MDTIRGGKAAVREETPRDLPPHVSAERPSPEEVELDRRIAELERLAEAAFGALSPDEEAALRAARLDQEHFFVRPTP